MKSFATVLFVVYLLYLCESQVIEDAESISDSFNQQVEISVLLVADFDYHELRTLDIESTILILAIIGVVLWYLRTRRTRISAGTVFVLKGEDVLLNVTKAVVRGEFDTFFWKFYNSNIVRFISKNIDVAANYTGRIDFPVNNYSVKLKNLQEADSGVYTAEVITLSTEEVAKYNVKVQDRASLPLLTVSSVSRNSSSCSFTVTCSSQDSHINSTFTCDNQTCSQEGGERSEGIPVLQVHQSSGSIVCNHSNHVSWTNTAIIIRDVCDLDPHQPNYVLIILLVFFTILALAIIGVLLWCYLRKRRTRKRLMVDNTVYDTAQFVDPAGPQDPTDDEDSVICLSSTYAMVGPHTGPAAPTETRNTAPLESLSVYAQVKKPSPGP